MVKKSTESTHLLDDLLLQLNLLAGKSVSMQRDARFIGDYSFNTGFFNKFNESKSP